MPEIDLGCILKAPTRSNGVIWLGALSFEQRCLASLVALLESRVGVDRILLIDYQTNVKPVKAAEDQRAANLGALDARFGRSVLERVETIKLSPYVYQDVSSFLDGELKVLGDSRLIVDITCITKIHAIALAAWMTRSQNLSSPFVAYTIPENYGFVDESLEIEPAWKDIIIAPLTETTNLFNEFASRGIVVPGHESYRLIVALGEIEPTGGLVVLAENRSRPDLRVLMMRRNGRLLRHLRLHAAPWKQCKVAVNSVGSMEKDVMAVISSARPTDAPVILFPFGPKPVIFAIASILARDYAESSWFVYPIPVAYDVNYSFDTDRVLWFDASMARKG